jgi:hypothetical protein
MITTPNPSRIRTSLHYRQHQQVHNLTVDDIHTYYVTAGTQPLLVHNCVKTNDVPAGPTFIGFESGSPAAIPSGATGPLPTKSPGMQFTGGSGGPGLDPKVTGVRVMDSTAHHPNRIVYMNGKGQTVSPLSGKTVPKNDPWAHIPW